MYINLDLAKEDKLGSTALRRERVNGEADDEGRFHETTPFFDGAIRSLVAGGWSAGGTLCRSLDSSRLSSIYMVDVPTAAWRGIIAAARPDMKMRP